MTRRMTRQIIVTGAAASLLVGGAVAASAAAFGNGGQGPGVGTGQQEQVRLHVDDPVATQTQEQSQQQLRIHADDPVATQTQTQEQSQERLRIHADDPVATQAQTQSRAQASDDAPYRLGQEADPAQRQQQSGDLDRVQAQDGTGVNPDRPADGYGDGTCDGDGNPDAPHGRSDS